MQIEQPICMKCANFTPGLYEDGMWYCKAFPTPEPWTEEEVKERVDGGNMLDPKGIPDEIIFGENNHSQPLEGQVGDFVFTPIE